MRRCQDEEPLPRELVPLHWAACHQTPEYETAPLTVPSLDYRRPVVVETPPAPDAEVSK
jgi:hypothetical protein